MHYSSNIKYISYIYKPHSWLHQVHSKVKLKFIFFYCFLATYHELSFSTIALSILLSLSLRYLSIDYYKDLYKIILSSIVLYSSLIISKFLYKNQYYFLGWNKVISIFTSFISLIIFNKLINYTTSREILCHDLRSHIKTINYLIFIIKISLDFLNIVEKKFLILIYSINNRDIKIKQLINNLQLIKKLLEGIIFFLLVEIYHEIKNFSQAIYLKNKIGSQITLANSETTKNKQCSRLSILDMTITLVFIILI
jgi:hypothetical protein